MPVRVSWFDETRRIILYELEGVWTWDDFYPVYEKAIAMETTSPERVDVILDMRQNKTVPANALLHIKGIADRQPPNLGVSVLVTSNRVIESLYAIGVRLYPSLEAYFDIAPSIDDALRIIEAARSGS
jgi:hypothetical protein